MLSKLSEGKRSGLERLSNARGVIAAAALDQRGLLKKMMAQHMEAGEPTDAMVSEFKKIAVALLTQYASAILLDVEYGISAMPYANQKGVMLAYEKSGYDSTAPEFIPSVTEGWSVLRLKEAGATAVKVLLYYTPFEKEWVNEQKKAWVERVGAECRALEIPMFLEFLGYDTHGEGDAAYARRKPEIVIASTEEFTKDRYGADVLKVEIPVAMRCVEGVDAFKGTSVYSKEQAQDYFRRAAEAATKPFVYLSAGVTHGEFIESLEFALTSGVSFHGVLCGRATWQDAIPIFIEHGASACRDWLAQYGAENLRAINCVLDSATPWKEKYLSKGSSI